MEKFAFPCKPVANPESVVVGAQYRFTVLDDKTLRYEWAVDGIFENRASTFAINREFPKPQFRVEDKDSRLDIFTSAFHLSYDKQRFTRNGLCITFTSKQTDWGAEWRYGDPARDNLGGTARTLDGVDGRCSTGNGILSTSGYAVLCDSETMLFDGNGFLATRRPGDRIDGYVFAYGYDFKGAIESFYKISGAQPPIPRWCLGNWWSRYYAYTASEYLSLMDRFKVKEYPLSVAVLDMDWHLVKGDHIPHTGWTGYTWNKDLFPDPREFLQALHERGLKVTQNDHPHAGVHCHEDIYEKMAQALSHDTSSQDPILFDTTSPDYMYAYLDVVWRHLQDIGCDFPWLDWQQGNTSSIPGFDPLWLLNHFHYLNQIQRKGEYEALIFSRYAGPGSHRCPVGFSGDTAATWASLQFQPEFTATAANIGYGWWSHDIGGNYGGSRDDECLVRWVQFGVFSPILRLHSSKSRWVSKEPWLYRPESENAIRCFMQLRHRLVPYIYSVTSVAATRYLPLVQPLYWNHPKTQSAYGFPDQYLFGPSLVIAPIVHPRDKTTSLAKTRAWVPPRRHVDIFTGCVYDGDQEIDLYRPLDRIPVLAPEGAIVPLDKARVPVNGCPNPSAFEILVVVGLDGRFTIGESTQDDAKPQESAERERLITIDYTQKIGRLQFVGAGREWTFRFLSTNIDPSTIRVLVDGASSSPVRCRIETDWQRPSTVIDIPSTSDPKTSIVIELGADPKLAVVDPLPAISDLLLDFQISVWLKDDIWRILECNQPVTIKSARLISLGLEENIFGPLAELLLADSRFK